MQLLENIYSSKQLTNIELSIYGHDHTTAIICSHRPGQIITLPWIFNAWQELFCCCSATRRNNTTKYLWLFSGDRRQLTILEPSFIAIGDFVRASFVVFLAGWLPTDVFELVFLDKDMDSFCFFAELSLPSSPSMDRLFVPASPSPLRGSDWGALSSFLPRVEQATGRCKHSLSLDHSPHDRNNILTCMVCTQWIKLRNTLNGILLCNKVSITM